MKERKGSTSRILPREDDHALDHQLQPATPKLLLIFQLGWHIFLQSFSLKQTPQTREVATCKQADKHHNKFGSDLRLNIHSNEPHPTRVGRYYIPHFQETFAA